MASLGGGSGKDPHLPYAAGPGGARGSSSYFGSGSHGGDGGGSLGALHSPWINRLRPPPRPRPRLLPAHESTVRARTPAVDPGAHAFLREHPPPRLAFAPHLPSRDDAAAAVASSSSHMLQWQQRGAEVEQRKRRGEAAQEEREGRGGMAVAFGPFQVRPKSAPQVPRQQQEQQPGWSLEGEKAGGGGRGSCGPMAGAFPGTGRGNCRPFVGDGCFPFFQRVARHGVAARREVGEVAERDGGEEGGVVMGSAAGSSQMIRNSRWLCRHRRGENSKLLDCHPASSAWPVVNGTGVRPQAVSAPCFGPRELVDEASRRRLLGQHVMASARGAAYTGTTDDTATTVTSYGGPATTLSCPVCDLEVTGSNQGNRLSA